MARDFCYKRYIFLWVLFFDGALSSKLLLENGHINQEFQDQPYLVVGMFGGPTNQKITLMRAMVEARMFNYTLVIPHFRGDFWRGIGAGATLLPLSHFLDVDHLLAFAEEKGISMVHTLPNHLVPACLAQLQFTPKPSVEADLPVWAKNFGVLCFQPNFSWEYLGTRTDQPGWESWENFRGGLLSAKSWEAEVDSVMELAGRKVEGLDRGFHVVHARIEEEYRNNCMQDIWELQAYCFVGDKAITQTLLGNFSVGRNELVFISSGANITDLPILCSTFRCFELGMVWPGFDALNYLEQAHMRYIFALKGKDCFGNEHSTFFNELGHAFKELGRVSESYNQPCDSHLQDCRVQGGTISRAVGTVGSRLSLRKLNLNLRKIRKPSQSFKI